MIDIGLLRSTLKGRHRVSETDRPRLQQCPRCGRCVGRWKGLVFLTDDGLCINLEKTALPLFALVESAGRHRLRPRKSALCELGQHYDNLEVPDDGRDHGLVQPT